MEASTCCADADDPRLLGRRTLDGKQQMQQKLRLEELEAEGRKSGATAGPVGKLLKVRPGQAVVAVAELRVKAEKAKGARTTGTLHEGDVVQVEEVATKAARVTARWCSGWVKLLKHDDPVLNQETWQVRALEEPSASSWVVQDVLSRLSAPRETAPAPREDVGMEWRAAERTSEAHVLQKDLGYPASCPSRNEEVSKAVRPADAFKHKPSVGTWLLPRPPAGRQGKAGPAADVTSCLSKGQEIAARACRPSTMVAFGHKPSVATWLAPLPQTGFMLRQSSAAEVSEPGPVSDASWADASWGTLWDQFCSAAWMSLCCGRL